MGNNKKQQTAASKFQIYTQLLFYIVLFIFPPISHRERATSFKSKTNISMICGGNTNEYAAGKGKYG